MHLTSYAARAVGHVNADLTRTDSFAALVAHQPWLAQRVTTAELGALRTVPGELAALVDPSALGQGAAVVAVLHRMLARKPLRPGVRGHHESRWPLHVNDDGATVTETLPVAEVGATRLGRRAAGVHR